MAIGASLASACRSIGAFGDLLFALTGGLFASAPNDSAVARAATSFFGRARGNGEGVACCSSPDGVGVGLLHFFQ